MNQTIEGSCHAPFVQGMKEKERLGHIVENPTTHEKIDACSFWHSRAVHRSDNHDLKDDGLTMISKPPSLFSFGK